MEIQILGSGCASCKTLEKLTISAVAEMNIAANVEKVEDITKILSYGIMRTPALVINNKVVMSGKVPTLKEIKEIIAKNI